MYGFLELGIFAFKSVKCYLDVWTRIDMWNWRFCGLHCVIYLFLDWMRGGGGVRFLI